MGFVQNARQRLGSAAHTIGKHAATVGKVALGAAAVAGAAYHAYQTHGQVQTRRGGGYTHHGPARHLDANMNPMNFVPSHTSTARYGPHGGLM